MIEKNEALDASESRARVKEAIDRGLYGGHLMPKSSSLATLVPNAHVATNCASGAGGPTRARYRAWSRVGHEIIRHRFVMMTLVSRRFHMRPVQPPTIRQPPLSEQAHIRETLPHAPLWRGLLAPPRCSDQNEHGTNDSSKDQDGESDLHPDPEVTDCRTRFGPPKDMRACRNPFRSGC